MTFGKFSVVFLTAAMMAVPVHAECPGAGCPAVDDEISMEVEAKPESLTSEQVSLFALALAAGVFYLGIAPSPDQYSKNNTTSNLCGEVGSTAAGNSEDPTTVLSEQFCAARENAKLQGLEILSKTAGFLPRDVPEKCADFVAPMKEYIQAVSLKPRDEVLQSVSSFVRKSGVPPSEIETNAKVCLGLGYAANLDYVALSTALVLAALGDESYSELIGYMLVSGYGGVSQRPDLALPWYESSLDGLADGESTSLAPNMPDRAALIRKAAVAAASETKSTGKEAPAAGQ
jgi:hypothetical protein